MGARAQQLKWASTCSPSWAHLLRPPPHLEFLLIYSASSPRRIALLLSLFLDSKGAVRKGRDDSSLWCKPGNTTALAGMLYLQECGECIWGDVWSSMTISYHPLFYMVYTHSTCVQALQHQGLISNRARLCLNWPVLSSNPWKIHRATPHRA